MMLIQHWSPQRAGYGLSAPSITGTDEFNFASAILEAAIRVYGECVTVFLDNLQVTACFLATPTLLRLS